MYFNSMLYIITSRYMFNNSMLYIIKTCMLSTLTIRCIQNQHVIYNKTILGLYI